MLRDSKVFCKGVKSAGTFAMPFLEERPIEKGLVGHGAQSPLNAGFCLATKAS